MPVRLLYFATIKDLLGKEGETLDLPVPMTPGELRVALIKVHPCLETHLRTCALAVNLEYTPWDARETCVQDGVEIALIPPVSGG